MDGIVSDASLFGLLADTRAVTRIRIHFISFLNNQLSVSRHQSETAQCPFMDVTEATDVFERRLITRLPACILVIRAKLYQAERHPRSGSDHPAGMSGTDAGIYVVSIRLKSLRFAKNRTFFYHFPVDPDAILTFFGRGYCWHRCFKDITRCIQLLGENRFPVEFNG